MSWCRWGDTTAASAVALLGLIGSMGCAGTRSPPADGASSAPIVEYRGGVWFIGNGFELRTMYVAGGRFVPRPRRSVDSTIDLRGGFVVPPFGEAHTHWPDAGAINAYVQLYLRDGVFYAMDQGTSPWSRARIDSLVNTPTSVDYISANLGWTGPRGHPMQIARMLVASRALPADWTEADFDGRWVLVARDSADIETKWPRYIADRPQFLKLFLLYSEEHARRSSDTIFAFRRGLDPSLVPELVRRAREANLRISAHALTAADFALAVRHGVDFIAHLPGSTGYDPALGPAAFRISAAAAEDAARRGVRVITTLRWLERQRDTARRSMILRDIVLPNVALLRQHGVPILIGSDQFHETSAPEAQLLVRHNLLSPIEALRSWAVETPRAIFPNRRIGRFEPGYEASFLVLEGDPLVDFAKTTRIALRVKQGHLLRVSDSLPAFPP